MKPRRKLCIVGVYSDTLGFGKSHHFTIQVVRDKKTYKFTLSDSDLDRSDFDFTYLAKKFISKCIFRCSFYVRGYKKVRFFLDDYEVEQIKLASNMCPYGDTLGILNAFA